ncbi:MAG TPA: LLM class flavin-dependent oxidoreductase [Anaerolineae bacterium]
MIEMGLQIIPTMPVREVIDTIRTAEELGYHYCVLADEGFMPDVYVALGLAARETSTIKLGPVTNGYTRHPAVTANAAATLNEVSGGRALVNLVAGGSMVLRPMVIPREAPLTVMRETIDILHRLWSGETVSYNGQRYRLEAAQITAGSQDIPVWLSVRGPKMLELSGRQAEAVVLMAKADLGAAIEIVERGSAKTGNRPTRIYLDRVAYTPEMLAKAEQMYPYTVMDSPRRMLHSMGLTDEQIEMIQTAFRRAGPAAMAKYITPEMIKNQLIAGTPEECSAILKALITEHQLDIFLLNVASPGLAANTRLLRDVAQIVRSAN